MATNFDSLWTIEHYGSKGWEIVWESDEPPPFAAMQIDNLVKDGGFRITSPIKRPTE